MHLQKDDAIMVWGLLGVAVFVVIIGFVFTYAPSPIQPVGEQVTNQTQDDDSEDDGTLPPPSQDFTATNSDRFRLSDNILVTLFPLFPLPSGSQSGDQGSGGNGGGGGGGGGGSRDRTPPEVTGIFSRPADIDDDVYTHPFTVTWVGKDDRSGIDFCDPPEGYSGPDGIAIVLEGHCTDNAGNEGTGDVTFNYNSTLFVPIFSYNLTLSDDEINAGSDISATAATNDTGITQVVFSWQDPSNSTAASNVKPVTVSAVRTAIDIFTVPNQSGVWTLDAHFQNANSDDVVVLTKTFVVLVSPAINFIYSLTLDRETVQINNPVLATAGTNDTNVTDVIFVWIDPENDIRASHVRPISLVEGTGTAQDSFIPDEPGLWKVDAHFNNITHADTAIRSKLFNVQEPNSNGNHRPVIVNDTTTTDEDAAVVINVLVNDSDPDGDSISISSFSQAANGSVTDNHNGTLTYTPQANYNGWDSFTYTVSDGSLESSPANVTISITPVNDAPIANAGQDQNVNEESLVSLSGSATDLDDDNLIFSWSQVSGPVPVALAATDTLTPSFIAPSVNHTDPASLQLTLTFELMVTDDEGVISSDTLVVVVNDVNKTPVADAGQDQTVNERFCSPKDEEKHEESEEDECQNDQSKKDDDDECQNIEIKHKEDDNDDDDECSRPTLVHLSGSGSDPDGDDLTFSWEQTKGPSVELSDANSATPSFTTPEADKDTLLTFELGVRDGFGGNSTDTVNILVLDVDSSS